MSTVVAFHAHPDDEVLWTDGTLARAAAQGHRVVVVVATDVMGPVPEGGSVRMRELRASAELLGVHRVEHLGYAGSGHGPVLPPDLPGRQRFVRADVGEAGERLAVILREEGADVLLSYDANGGYGHRDHVKVHEVGARAAELSGVGSVLEATMPREVVARLVRWVRLLRIPFRYDTDELLRLFSARADITHQIDVRPFARQKQAAMAAHRSQLGGGRLAPVMRTLVGMPSWAFARFVGREWFIDQARTPAGGVLGDIVD